MDPTPDNTIGLRDFIAIAAFLVALGSFLHNQFIQKAKDQERLNNVEDKVADIEEVKKDIHSIQDFLNDKVRPVLPQVDLFWKLVQTEFPKMLMHDGEPQRDVLLMKLSNNTIRLHELEDLEAIIDTEFEHIKDRGSSEALLNRINHMVIQKCKGDERDP